MAKYQFTELYSGINFNSVDTSLMGVGKKVGNDDNRGADTETLTEIAADNGGKLPTIVNAVEIDWNSAEITSTAFPSMDRTINTTGDLLSWIKEGIEEAAVSGRTSGVVRRSLWIN